MSSEDETLRWPTSLDRAITTQLEMVAMNLKNLK